MIRLNAVAVILYALYRVLPELLSTVMLASCVNNARNTTDVISHLSVLYKERCIKIT